MRLQHQRSRPRRDHNRLRPIRQHRRTMNLRPHRQIPQLVDGRLQPATAKVHLGRGMPLLRLDLPPLHRLELLIHALLLILKALANPPHPHIIHNNIPLIQRKPKLIAMVLDKRPPKIPPLRRLDNHQRRLRPSVPHIQILLKHNLPLPKPLLPQRPPRPLLQPLHLPLQPLHHLPRLPLPNRRIRLLPLIHHIRQRHPIRRQHRRVSVNQDLLDAERLGNRHGMLPSRPAKRRQPVLGRIVPFRLGNTPDRARHGLVGDRQKPVRHLVHPHVLARLAVDLPRQLPQHALARRGIQPLVLVLPKDLWEKPRQQPAQVQIRVGDRRGPAFPVTRRTGVRAGGLGADDEQPVLEEEHGPAAGGDGVDVELGGLDRDAGGRRLKRVVVAPLAVARHVGAGAAHVKADDGDLGGAVVRRDGVPDDAAGRAREDGFEA